MLKNHTSIVQHGTYESHSCQSPLGRSVSSKTDKSNQAKQKDEETRVAILLHCIGEDGLEVFNTFEFGTEEDKKKLD